jgi:RNA polymerase sigma-70 factor (ECF subfamily)
MIQYESTDSRHVLERACAGDAGAAEDLLAAHRGPLLARIRMMMRNVPRREQDSLDVLQDVQVRALGNIERFADDSGEDAFLRWLTAIARNRLRDLGRRRRIDALESLSISLGGIAAGHEGPERPMLREEATDELLAALDVLDADHRTVIELRDLDELAFSAIAVRMRRSENAVRLLRARALVRLGAALRR